MFCCLENFAGSKIVYRLTKNKGWFYTDFPVTLYQLSSSLSLIILMFYFSIFFFFQQRRVELTEMASRPFAIVTMHCGEAIQRLKKASWSNKMHLEPPDTGLNLLTTLSSVLLVLLLNIFTVIFQVEPTQISLESFQRGNIGITSIFIELPRTETGFAPTGQSGLCIGSTLVTQRSRAILNNQHQLCIFPERRKNQYRNPVAV